LRFCSEDAECTFYYAGVSTGHPKGADSILNLYSIIRPIFITQIMPLCLVHELITKWLFKCTCLHIIRGFYLYGVFVFHRVFNRIVFSVDIFFRILRNSI
jgi:hypothetical protein